ncbi:thiamine phosphate synthase [Neogemmobacter tilapiae]|nr:thiamine phosphate synthase [Gemmobacter tilapiae]
MPDAVWVTRVVGLGARMVQLRAKGFTPDILRDQALRAQEICDRAGAELVLNDHWKLAIDLGIKAVHLGQEDMATADFTAIRRASIAFGLSTHDEAELDRALSHDPAYIALGPIYETRLKVMPWAPQGLEKLTRWKAAVGSKPLVAIGGLTPERLPGVFAAGADVAAVVTDLVTAEDAAGRVAEWRGACDAL